MKDMQLLRQHSVVLPKRKIILNFKKRENTSTMAISLSLTDRVVNLGTLPLSFSFICPWNLASTPIYAYGEESNCSWDKQDPPLNFLFYTIFNSCGNWLLFQCSTEIGSVNLSSVFKTSIPVHQLCLETPSPFSCKLSVIKKRIRQIWI